MSSTFAEPEFEETIGSQLTLGTASLLGIFFGLVMVCGIFFGFGYSFGRRSYNRSMAISQKPAVVSAPVATSTVAKATMPTSPQLSLAPVPLPALQNPTVAVSKVSAPSPMVLPTVSVPVANTLKPATKSSVPVTEASVTSAPMVPSTVLKQVLAKPSAIHPVLEESAISLPYQRRVGVSPNALRSPSTPYVYTPPFFVHTHGGVRHPVFTTTQNTLSTPHEVLTVQIAAMSRQDDAEVLASSLRKRGFATSIHNDAEDSLYHVQVGPYQRNVAVAARQKLIANGYNAVIK